MKIQGTVLALLTFLLPGVVTGDDKPRKEPPPSGISVLQSAGQKVVEAVLPGRLLDTTWPNLPLYLLVAKDSENDDANSRTLLEFDPSGDGRLEVLASGLPKTIRSVHTLAGHGGREKILLGEPGAIYRLNMGASTLEPLFKAKHLDLGYSKHFLAGDELLIPRVGQVESWAWNDGRLEHRHSLELPVRVDRQRGGLRVFTPPLSLLKSQGTQNLVLGPVPQGRQRLHSEILSFGAEGEGSESWSLLPSPEAVEDRWYVSIDGKPALVVTTTSTEKIGVFEKKKLRVFPLSSDRTRSGRAPRLALDTTTRRWFSPSVEVLDWDDDGRDDLVLITPDGFGGKKLILSVYFGKGSRTFSNRPRKTVIVAPQADWHFGSDLDGDRRPDLVTADENGLRIFSGASAENKKLVVEKTPRRTWTLEQLAASDAIRKTLADFKEEDDELYPSDPTTIDSDGDGRHEILVRTQVPGATILWWIGSEG